jgi:hypothetical protein
MESSSSSAAQDESFSSKGSTRIPAMAAAAAVAAIEAAVQLWYTDLEACSKAIFLLPSPYTCVRPHHTGKVEPFLHRGLVLKAMLFDFSLRIIFGQHVAF